MKVLYFLSIILFSLLSNGVSAQSDKELERRFNIIDADRNEVITIREMKRYYKEKTNKDGEPIDAKKLFYGLDANRNSIITLNEYLNGVDWKLAYEYLDRWQYKPTEEDEVNKKNSEPIENTVIEAASSNPKVSRKKQVFEDIDLDENNELNIQEVKQHYNGMINQKTGKPINGVFNFYAYDHNDDGKIVFDEFLNGQDFKAGWKRMKNAENNANEKVQNSDEPSEGYVKKRIELFYEVDTDKNFKITLEELKAYYKDKTNNQGKPVNALFKYYGLDKNEDGTIELAEFASKIDLDLAKRRYKNRDQ